MTTSKLLFALMGASFCANVLLPLAPQAQAQTTTHVEKRTTKTIIKETESDNDDDGDDYDMPPPHRYREHKEKPTESVITTRFGGKGQSGTMGCKTEDLAAEAVKDLKGDCNAWVKDQKADLKDRYLTSNCEEVREDCGTALKRCSVNGTVHYIVK